MTWPGNAPKRTLFRKPDTAFQRQIDRADTIAWGACPGEGRCHGPMGWCDDCGDVDEMCNCLECDRHRCARCHCIVRRDDHREDYPQCKECEDAERQEAIEREAARRRESEAAFARFSK